MPLSSMSQIIASRSSDRDHLQWLRDAGVSSFNRKKILDLGCGSGFVCQKAIAEGAELAIGIDLVKPHGAEQSKWQFMTLDLDSGGWQKKLPYMFDLILAFDIIEHLSSPYNFLKSCNELLSTNGQLVLTTPNVNSWERLIKPESWSGIIDPQHKTLFNKYSLKYLLKQTGFKTSFLKAPLRKLSFLGPLQPQVGGQLLVKADKS